MRYAQKANRVALIATGLTAVALLFALWSNSHALNGAGPMGGAGGSGGTPGGSDTQIQFNNSGAFGGSSNLTWNGTALISGMPTSSGFPLGITPQMQIQANAQTNFFGVTASNTPAASFEFLSWRSRGTLDSPSVVANGDRLFLLGGLGYGSSTWGSNAGGLLCEVDGSPSGNNIPSRLKFIVSTAAGANPTAMTITNDTNIEFAGSVKLDNKSASSTPTGGAIVESVSGIASVQNTDGSGGNIIVANGAQTISGNKTFSGQMLLGDTTVKLFQTGVSAFRVDVWNGSGYNEPFFTNLNSVGINNTSPAATLDVVSTTHGALLPRMTTTQRNAITPTEGEEVYDSTLHKKYVYDGTTWQACW